MKKIVFYISVFVVMLGVISLFFQAQIMRYFLALRQNRSPEVVERKDIVANGTDIGIVAKNLDIPWELVFLSDGDMLVTERSGQLLKIGAETKIIQEIEGVAHVGEGGLLGLALHPDFAQNNLLYIYLTTESDIGLFNQVIRYQLVDDALTNPQIILDDIPGSQFHDGGRIAFGPDGYLYITVGDAQNPDQAQNNKSLNGSILRITAEGDIPADNPFGNAIYSYGHRNPQGLTWDTQGNLWSTEHGRSGIASGYDELNLIKKGGNYGWPDSQGDEANPGTIAPILHSGATHTWAPGDALYLDRTILIPGLRGERLYQVILQDNQVTDVKEYFVGQYGRLRSATLGPDGYIYLLTSNNDGRGNPTDVDDRIIRFHPSLLE